MNKEDKYSDFIKKSTLKHGVGVFNYLNIKYINTTTQLQLSCNKHDFIFMVTPVAHFKGAGGCPLCYKESQYLFHKNQKVGQKIRTNEGYIIEIIEYYTSTNCTIQFEDGTILKNKNYSDIIKGQIKNPNNKLKLGFGYIGVGEYSSTIHIKAYKKWYNMLNRSYNNKKCFESYKNIEVCAEWHEFQNFAEWFYKNFIFDIMQNWELDKDILVKGNKIYSPETCCFVPKEVNCLFLKSNTTRGVLPIGVTLTKSKKYSAKLRKYSKISCLGTFNTPEEAFKAYKNTKENYIKEVAEKYKEQLTPQTYRALINYKVEITD